MSIYRPIYQPIGLQWREIPDGWKVSWRHLGLNFAMGGRSRPMLERAVKLTINTSRDKAIAEAKR